MQWICGHVSDFDFFCKKEKKNFITNDAQTSYEQAITVNVLEKLLLEARRFFSAEKGKKTM